MRKISQQAVAYFVGNRSRKLGNTVVSPYFCEQPLTRHNLRVKDYNPNCVMLLHGNAIAWKAGSYLYVTLAGWNTPTTRERLNTLLGAYGIDAYFFQHRHAACFGTHDDYLDRMDYATVCIHTGARDFIVYR
mgnify:CR=1 FL=1